MISISLHINPLTTTTLTKFPSFRSGFLPLNPSMASFRHPISSSSSKGQSLSAHRAAGEVHVIVGPMFVGKTTALLPRIKSEVDNGGNVAMIKSSKDTIYAIDSVVINMMGLNSHAGHCQIYRLLDKILEMMLMRRGSFGSVLHIIPIADTVTKLTARCELCDKRAFFTSRKTEEIETELIGGADVYMPVCPYHYVNGQVVVEAARSVMESHKMKSGSFLVAAPVV